MKLNEKQIKILKNIVKEYGPLIEKEKFEELVYGKISFKNMYKDNLIDLEIHTFKDIKKEYKTPLTIEEVLKRLNEWSTFSYTIEAYDTYYDDVEVETGDGAEYIYENGIYYKREIERNVIRKYYYRIKI